MHRSPQKFLPIILDLWDSFKIKNIIITFNVTIYHDLFVSTKTIA